MVTLALLDSFDLTTVLKWWHFEDKTEITIGRSSHNDIVIQDPRISRHHVLLSKLSSEGGERWQLTNQGKNNVSLNGRITFRDVVPDMGEIQLAPNGPRMCFFLSDQKTAANLLKGLRGKPQAIQTSPQDHLGYNLSPVNPEMISTSYRQTLEEIVSGTSLCDHVDNNPHQLFCGNCGYPLVILGSIRQYDLLKVLSQGEEAYTFLAWINPNYRELPVFLNHSLVVIKQLNPSAVKSLKEQELFMRQAMTLNQLDHPTIPHFLDFFSEARQFYLVMEWIPGQNLEEHIRERGTLTPAQAIACGFQVCSVLEYLQHQNPPLVHRDIKPANLILRYSDGRIVLVDFGVVKPLGGLEQTRLALSGYRAPEQLHGKTYVQSDFFGIGATLLYLLTGRNPSQIHRYKVQTASYYFNAVPGITKPLAEALVSLLNPNPGDRYQSISEVKQGLKLAQESCRHSPPPSVP
ncbi:MAG: protein kinase domain-containing protein [Prochlorotrichaceae cyanobacterium]